MGSRQAGVGLIVRSNVFVSAALAMWRCGYSVLPIMAGAKRPGTYRGFVTEDGDGPWFGLKDWQNYCTERASEAKAASWGRMADAKGGGLGVACGFGGFVAIDIDDDDLVAPILAVLPPVLVAKRGRFGQTIFMRVAEPMPSAPYDGPDGRLLDFLSAGRQTVLPPTLHPELGQPYHWTTERTLLNTPLDALPLFTDAHRAAMEEVLREHGWNAPEPPQPRREAVERLVVSSRPTSSGASHDPGPEFWRGVVRTMPQWVPKLGLQGLTRVGGGWRSVASFRESGSGKAKRGLSLSILDTGQIKDHGGTGLNAISLVGLCLFGGNNGEAYSWLCEESGFKNAHAVAPDVPVAPTYADNRVSLVEALASVQSVFGDKFLDAILEARAARNRAKIKRPLIFHVPPVEIIPPETGIGKTRTAREAIARLTKAGIKFVYAVPDHGLTKEIAADFAVIGIHAEIYRGFDQPDPRAPKKHKMCRRPEAFKAVQSLGIATHSTICESSDGLARCQFAKQCALMKQRAKRPDVWIVPHALLFTKRPDFFFEPDAVVIDESFHKGAIATPFEVDVDALRLASITDDVDYSNDERDALTTYRHRLRDAVKDNGNGPLSRTALIQHGIDAETAGWLQWLERRPLDAVGLSPGMNEREIKSAAKDFKAKANKARNASGAWDAVCGFLYSGDAASGWFTVGGSTLLVSPRREVHRTWLDAPVVYMDATPLPVNLVEHVLGRFSAQGLPSGVTKHPDIKARWSPHVFVRQIVGGPSTMNRAGVGRRARETGKHKTNNTADTMAYIKLRSALARPGRIGVVTFKELRERIEGQLPADIVWMHHGAVAGRNEMETVTGLIVIGRPSAARRSVEADAAVLTGRTVVGGGDRFEYEDGGIRLADGSAVATRMERHDDQDVEALRWLITEGGLIQAIGRLRPHRRAEPCWLDIVADVPLPLAVHEVVPWGTVKPGAVGDMALQGVVLPNVSDAQRAFKLSDWAARGVGGFSKEYISLELPPSPRPFRRLTYQKAGSGHKECEGWFLPAIVGDEASLREWLEVKLGPLASLTVDRVKAKDSPAVQAMFAKIGRDSLSALPKASAVIESLRAIAARIERDAAGASDA